MKIVQGFKLEFHQGTNEFGFFHYWFGAVPAAIFMPEEKTEFMIEEIKAIVQEMEKMNAIRPE